VARIPTSVGVGSPRETDQLTNPNLVAVHLVSRNLMHDLDIHSSCSSSPSVDYSYVSGWGKRRGESTKESPLLGVAIVAFHESADLAAPNCHEGSAIALGATPSQNVSIAGLNDGPFMSTTSRIGHG
jgi:hypothetical protein